MSLRAICSNTKKYKDHNWLGIQNADLLTSILIKWQAKVQHVLVQHSRLRRQGILLLLQEEGAPGHHQKRTTHVDRL